MNRKQDLGSVGMRTKLPLTQRTGKTVEYRRLSYLIDEVGLGMNLNELGLTGNHDLFVGGLYRFV